MILATAILCSLALQMREWTGIRTSAQWPVGASILLMIIWMAVYPRTGFRMTVLTGSLLGIAIGLAVARIERFVELGRPIDLSSLGLPGIGILPIAGTYAIALWLENRIDGATAKSESDGRAETEARFKYYESLPPEERGQKMKEDLDALLAEADRVIANAERGMSVIRVLIWLSIPLILLAMGLTIRHLIHSPPEGVVQLLVLLSIPILGAVALVVFCQFLRADHANSKADRSGERP